MCKDTRYRRDMSNKTQTLGIDEISFLFQGARKRVRSGRKPIYKDKPYSTYVRRVKSHALS